MYEVIQHSSTVTPRHDIELDENVGVLPDEGLWISSTGKVAQGSDRSVAMPNWTSPQRTDVQELHQVTVIFGEHLADTDKFYDKTGTGFSVGEDLTVSEESGHEGKLEQADSSDPVVARVYKLPSENDGKLQIKVD